MNIIHISLLTILSIIGADLRAQTEHNTPSPRQQIAQQRPINSASVIYQKNAKSIVTIEATDQTGTSQGSGVAFRNGYAENSDKKSPPASTWIITNAHVVKKASVVNVIIDEIPTKAKVEYSDADFDIAIVFAENLVISPVDKPLRPLSIAPGDSVYALGSPKGLSRTITEGIVSAKRTHAGARVIQTSAAISPGSSGGGLFDQSGRLIGITTFKVVGGESLNFAIDANHAMDLIQALDAASLIEAFSGVMQQSSKFKLVKWMSTATGESGRPVLEEFQKAENTFFRDMGKNYVEANKVFSNFALALLERQVKANNSSSSNSEQTKSSVEKPNTPTAFRLVCQIPMKSGPPLVKTFEIDINSRTVDGFDANISTGYISYESTKTRQRFSYSFDRTASILTIGSDTNPSMYIAPCSKVEGRAF